MSFNTAFKILILDPTISIQNRYLNIAIVKHFLK